MATISLNGLVKRYPNGFEAVKGIDLEVAEGEFVVLVDDRVAARRRSCEWWLGSKRLPKAS